ncbi:MAG: restriction endonuclease [Methanobacteriaceae archaeon]
MGMLAAVYPSKCAHLSNFKIDFKKQKPHRRIKIESQKYIIKYEGHHPNCGKFNSHVFILKGKKYCAGCTGLFLGGLLAVIGTLIYYFGYNSVYLMEFHGQIVFWIGFFAVLFSLIQLIFINLNNNLIKFSSNLLLVLGSFFILIGIDAIQANISLEIYFLILVLFWILTRIRISQNNHKIRCLECEQSSACDLEYY